MKKLGQLLPAEDATLHPRGTVGPGRTGCNCPWPAPPLFQPPSRLENPRVFPPTVKEEGGVQAEEQNMSEKGTTCQEPALNIPKTLFSPSAQRGTPGSGPHSTHPGTKDEKQDHTRSFSLPARPSPQFSLASHGGEGRTQRFSFRTSRESSVSRIREGSFPRSNVLALKHLDLYKGQPAKRELGPPRRAGLGRVPGLGKGPLGETWLCSQSATTVAPSSPTEEKQQAAASVCGAGFLPRPQPPAGTGLRPGPRAVRWGIQMSQQPFLRAVSQGTVLGAALHGKQVRTPAPSPEAQTAGTFGPRGEANQSTR